MKSTPPLLKSKPFSSFAKSAHDEGILHRDALFRDFLQIPEEQHICPHHQKRFPNEMSAEVFSMFLGTASLPAPPLQNHASLPAISASNPFFRSIAPFPTPHPPPPTPHPPPPKLSLGFRQVRGRAGHQRGLLPLKLLQHLAQLPSCLKC